MLQVFERHIRGLDLLLGLLLVLQAELRLLWLVLALLLQDLGIRPLRRLLGRGGLSLVKVVCQCALFWLWFLWRLLR